MAIMLVLICTQSEANLVRINSIYDSIIPLKYSHEDSIYALNNMRNRRIKGKYAGIVLGLGVVGTFSLSDNSTSRTGNNIVIGISTIAIIADLISLRKYRKTRFQKVIDSYNVGVPIPNSFKKWIKKNDFTRVTK